MKPYQEEQEIQIDVLEVLKTLQNNLLLIFLCGIIGASLAFSVALGLMTPEYRSTTKVYVLPNTSTNNITSQDLSAGTQLTKDYSELVKSRPVLEKVIATQHLDESVEQLSSQITVDTSSDTRIITINVMDKNPKVAKDIANTLNKAVKEQLTSVTNVTVNTVEDANLPTSPYSPNVLRITLMGFLCGIAAAIAVNLILFFVDDTLKSSEDVEKHLGVTNLGSVPMAQNHTGKKPSLLKRLKNRIRS